MADLGLEEGSQLILMDSSWLRREQGATRVAELTRQASSGLKDVLVEQLVRER